MRPGDLWRSRQLGRIFAGVEGAIDWLHFSKDVQEVMTNYWKEVDTTLMGRKTYAVAAAQGRPPGKTPKTAKRRTGKEQALTACLK